MWADVLPRPPPSQRTRTHTPEGLAQLLADAGVGGQGGEEVHEAAGAAWGGGGGDEGQASACALEGESGQVGMLRVHALRSAQRGAAASWLRLHYRPRPALPLPEANDGVGAQARPGPGRAARHPLLQIALHGGGGGRAQQAESIITLPAVLPARLAPCPHTLELRLWRCLLSLQRCTDDEGFKTLDHRTRQPRACRS